MTAAATGRPIRIINLMSERIPHRACRAPRGTGGHGPAYHHGALHQFGGADRSTQPCQVAQSIFQPGKLLKKIIDAGLPWGGHRTLEIERQPILDA